MGKIVLNGKEYISTLPSPFPPLIYSTDEREIGVWTDGKPLYQKTISFTTGTSGGYRTYSTGLTNIESALIDYGNSYYVNNRSKIQATPYVSTVDTMQFAIFASINVSNEISLDYRVGDSAESKSAIITLQYTKNTDTAGSGHWATSGAPAHHYSTIEQVVGTWIDGKPIYEKTWDLGGTGLEISYNSWTSSTISKSGIETIINVESRNGTGGAYFGDVMASTEVDNTYIAFQTARNGNNERIRYVTLQYTKTTD